MYCAETTLISELKPFEIEYRMRKVIFVSAAAEVDGSGYML